MAGRDAAVCRRVDGDQTGGQWGTIRFHIPTYIGTGLSGHPYVGSDMDGIFGGGNRSSTPAIFSGKPSRRSNLTWTAGALIPKRHSRLISKQRRSIVPTTSKDHYDAFTTYGVAKCMFDGKPMVRGLFMIIRTFLRQYTDLVKYEYLWGDNFCCARNLPKHGGWDERGNDVRNGIYLPNKQQVWVDYYTGKE